MRWNLFYGAACIYFLGCMGTAPQRAEEPVLPLKQMVDPEVAALARAVRDTADRRDVGNAAGYDTYERDITAIELRFTVQFRDRSVDARKPPDGEIGLEDAILIDVYKPNETWRWRRYVDQSLNGIHPYTKDMAPGKPLHWLSPKQLQMRNQEYFADVRQALIALEKQK